MNRLKLILIISVVAMGVVLGQRFGGRRYGGGGGGEGGDTVFSGTCRISAGGVGLTGTVTGFFSSTCLKGGGGDGGEDQKRRFSV